MRIAIDARAFAWEGIGRYTRNILNGLLQTKNSHRYVVLLPQKEVTAFQKYVGVPLSRYELQVVDDSYYSLREQTVLLRQLLSTKADLYHFFHFNVPVLFRRPFVVTIHDITRFIFPGQKRQSWLQQVAYEYVFKNAVEHARAVITVSKTTQQELQTLPVKLPRLVKTIYEGVDDDFLRSIKSSERQKVRMLLGTNEPYLLFVGVWMSHKNLVRLLQAYAEIRKHFPVKLVVTGRPKPGYGTLLHLTRQLRLEDDVIFPGFVPQKLLPALYAKAACFAFPSLYEGFGLPALEAAACGTPVVTSNVSSLPEIMGPAAIYVNPESVSSITSGIGKVLSDNGQCRQLIKMGYERVSRFSWQEAARSHAELYENILSS